MLALTITAQLTPKRVQRRASADAAKVTGAFKRAVAAKKAREALAAETIDAFAREEFLAWQQRREQRQKDILDAMKVLEDALKQDVADLAVFAGTLDEDDVLVEPIVFKDFKDGSERPDDPELDKYV